MAKKMNFTQIGKNRLMFDVQEAFEEAQRHVDFKNTKASVTLKINIYPTERDSNFGKVDYEVDVKKSANKSRQYHTLIEGGVIVADGGDPTDALQLETMLEGTNA